MNVTRYTAGGAAVFEPTEAEFDQFLEQQIREAFNISLATFVDLLRTGALDLGDPVVSELAPLVQTRS
jgi:hypothetical protein